MRTIAQQNISRSAGQAKYAFIKCFCFFVNLYPLADNQRTTSHKCFVYLMNYARCRHLTIIHYKGGKLRNDDTAA